MLTTMASTRQSISKQASKQKPSRVTNYEQEYDARRFDDAKLLLTIKLSFSLSNPYPSSTTRPTQFPLSPPPSPPGPP